MILQISSLFCHFCSKKTVYACFVRMYFWALRDFSNAYTYISINVWTVPQDFAQFVCVVPTHMYNTNKCQLSRSLFNSKYLELKFFLYTNFILLLSKQPRAYPGFIQVTNFGYTDHCCAYKEVMILLVTRSLIFLHGSLLSLHRGKHYAHHQVINLLTQVITVLTKR